MICDTLRYFGLGQKARSGLHADAQAALLVSNMCVSNIAVSRCGLTVGALEHAAQSCLNLLFCAAGNLQGTRWDFGIRRGPFWDKGGGFWDKEEGFWDSELGIAMGFMLSQAALGGLVARL